MPPALANRPSLHTASTMTAGEPRIVPLPGEVITKIQSSATITSLNETVIGLSKNSLDSGARHILIEVDYTRGGCVVEDDGGGIAPAEFREDGGLGKLHCSLPLLSINQLLTDCVGRHLEAYAPLEYSWTPRRVLGFIGVIIPVDYHISTSKQ